MYAQPDGVGEQVAVCSGRHGYGRIPGVLGVCASASKAALERARSPFDLGSSIRFSPCDRVLFALPLLKDASISLNQDLC